MAYTLGQAAAATGKSKTGILKAIDTGRISATKNEMGQWQIEPAELHRVYAVNAHPMPKVRAREPHQSAEIERLKATVEGLEKLNHQIEGERDRVCSQLDNLRDQNTRLMALLSSPQPQPTPAKKWWQFGGRR
jgi:seryl-tRNA synthetase